MMNDDERRRGGPKVNSRYRSGNITTGVRRSNESSRVAVRQASNGIDRLVRLKRVLGLPSSVSSLIQKGGPFIALLHRRTCKSILLCFTGLYSALVTATVALGAWRHAHHPCTHASVL